MIYIIWEFQVDPFHIIEFEKKYGLQGEWVTLFKKSKDYHGTIFLKDNKIPFRYLTIDQWRDIIAFEEFKSQNLKHYNELDAKCDKLTISENEIGFFEVV